MNKDLKLRIEKVISIIDNQDKVIDTSKYNGMKKILLYGIRPKEKNIIPIKEYLEQNTKFNIVIVDKHNIDECLNKTFERKTIFLSNKYYEELSKFKKDFFLLDFNRITLNKRFIFLSNFNEFTFKDMKKETESNEYGGIKWRNRNILNLGDIIYIYFFDLPDGISRIMLKGQVIDDGFHSEGETNNEYCKYENDQTDKNSAVRIKVICVFDNKESRIKFNKLALKKEGLHFNNYVSKVVIDSYPKLVEKLETFINNYIKTNPSETKVSYFEKHFGLDCEFKDYPKNGFFEYNHKSFVKNNGYNHYVIHHLIEQHHVRKGNINDEFVYNSDNEIPLCANCHNRIHYGVYDDRIKMVLYIYEKRKHEIDKLLDEIPKENYKDIKSNYNKKLFWLLKQYVPEQYINDEVLKKYKE